EKLLQRLHVHDGPDGSRLSSAHQIVTLVDPVKWQMMGDERIHINLSLHVPVDKLGEVRTRLHSTLWISVEKGPR
ncbi:MAG TPA: hypothetical protein VGC77_18990, partial [Rhodopseudomonas sp.]|uniref:hypothetical protein n=1 Tax=Rhodopseudomonas sp. TaxID=1078 RepID=UPI002EDB60AE